MRKNRTLILIETNPSKDIFFNDWINRGYKAEILFKKTNKIFRAVRRIWLKNNLPFPNIWLNDWYKELNKYDTLIIHSSYLTRYLPFNLIKKNPNLRIINWYWNTVDKETLPIQTSIKNIEYWTFDDKDCKKYNMRKNIQYYIDPKEISLQKEEYDIYFVGRNKGRKKIIDEIKTVAEKQNLKCNFRVLEDNSNDIIPYVEIKKDLLNTKTILDINKQDQDGFTLRVFESLFFEKKLITNNKNVKRMPFYNQNNIFIIGEDNYMRLHDFVNSNYDIKVNIYKENYELDTWFGNFGKNNQ